MHRLARLDHRYVWHPFTQMREWVEQEPIVIVEGKGAVLGDAKGKEYLDANASIWTNLHGHSHPKINAALRRQLGRIAHSSALGLANEPASLLAERLVRGVAGGRDSRARGGEPNGETGWRRGEDQGELLNPVLERAFFSDDGSTALEVALKLAYDFARRSGRSQQPRFLSLSGAYHGDTVGAVSLGHIDQFHQAYRGLLFRSDKVMAPYCYRCAYNLARPERADAREYRRCDWECVREVERLLDRRAKRKTPYAAFVVEPLMQGAAGMIPQPIGWLRRVTERVRGCGTLLIADEVMSGLGRAGVGGQGNKVKGEVGVGWCACHREGVQPDFLCWAKGLTGGYLPMAATLTTGEVFGAFLGEYEELKAFFHGHSYTGNQMGAAAALASLDLLDASVAARARLERWLAEEIADLWAMPQVGDVRRVGLVVGIELVRDWRTREAFELRDRAGLRVCEAMARRGVLTRPVGNVVVLMPPYCMSQEQVKRMVSELKRAIRSTFR